MKKIILGQFFLIVCCVFYLVWWYRGYRPGVNAQRTSGINGILLLITAAFGLLGAFLSAGPASILSKPRMDPAMIIIAGIFAYIVLLLITKVIFHRVVTAELLLITAWTVLELSVINTLNAAGGLPDKRFYIMFAVIIAAFIISMILYVAYYRMEEMKAFYAAMVPLVTESAAMAILIGMVKN